MLNVILGSFGAFPIFENLVSRKQLLIERNRVKFGPQGWEFSVYRILVKLNASDNSGGHSVYFWFWTQGGHLVSRKRQVLEWKIYLDLCVIQFMWSLSSILSSRAPSPWASCLCLLSNYFASLTSICIYLPIILQSQHHEIEQVNSSILHGNTHIYEICNIWNMFSLGTKQVTLNSPSNLTQCYCRLVCVKDWECQAIKYDDYRQHW